ncbi:HAD-IA family hydrolase [Shewanella sp. 202IG2-18]|uniref:HAD-IA family hydrolase n=1 Tax=Parashewanella hymeniacidonis TaxID=2807618 RepID=UPI0019605D9C|nr:HAD-IA family hydrolase [Parashewanella hymeniacidonis]MBM7071217.1 HAD-IA family hydrolase [Parashewanella hymeniacidonis]
MRCFLNLKPIKVISFDLDDTLYDNRPYILKAESEFLSFMQKHYPAEHQWQSEYWRAEKQKLESEQPEISHDTWQSREQNAKRILLSMGLNQQDANSGAKAGLEHFLHYRSDFKVPEKSIELLKLLATKFKLIGISNGNVDPKRIGIAQYFEFILHAGNGHRMKPAPDMFIESCSRLQVQPQEILHVGDNFAADVVGARLFGCQAAWLNPAFGRVEKELPDSLLPHISLDSVFELTSLTDS